VSLEKEIKTDRLNIRIESSFKLKLKEAAHEENRNLANFVLNALQTYLEEKSKNKG